MCQKEKCSDHHQTLHDYAPVESISESLIEIGSAVSEPTRNYMHSFFFIYIDFFKTSRLFILLVRMFSQQKEIIEQ